MDIHTRTVCALALFGIGVTVLTKVCGITQLADVALPVSVLLLVFAFRAFMAKRSAAKQTARARFSCTLPVIEEVEEEAGVEDSTASPVEPASAVSSLTGVERVVAEISAPSSPAPAPAKAKKRRRSRALATPEAKATVAKAAAEVKQSSASKPKADAVKQVSVPAPSRSLDVEAPQPAVPAAARRRGSSSSSDSDVTAPEPEAMPVAKVQVAVKAVLAEAQPAKAAELVTGTVRWAGEKFGFVRAAAGRAVYFRQTGSAFERKYVRGDVVAFVPVTEEGKKRLVAGDMKLLTAAPEAEAEADAEMSDASSESPAPSSEEEEACFEAPRDVWRRSSRPAQSRLPVFQTLTADSSSADSSAIPAKPRAASHWRRGMNAASWRDVREPVAARPQFNFKPLRSLAGQEEPQFRWAKGPDAAVGFARRRTALVQ